ncbi:hypothetical protein CMI42_03195 [Candidatus Pacearchaeota archaeon]|nr:hypothetical protein [Candidatus Pacearchaeota archaeon]|tara:strand:+ start:53 stop:430 length:378 start_codon:yes stop_codon:yes gene_type:complete
MTSEKTIRINEKGLKDIFDDAIKDHVILTKKSFDMNNKSIDEIKNSIKEQKEVIDTIDNKIKEIEKDAEHKNLKKIIFEVLSQIFIIVSAISIGANLTSGGSNGFPMWLNVSLVIIGVVLRRISN